MGTLLLKSRDNYPDTITTTLSVHTPPKLSVVFVEPDNATLIIHQLEENSDETFVIENVLKQKEPKYSELNLVISMVMSDCCIIKIYGTTFMIDGLNYRAFPPVEADPFEDAEYPFEDAEYPFEDDEYPFKDDEYLFENEEYIPRKFAHTKLSQSNTVFKIQYKNNHIVFRTEYNVPKILDTSTTFK